MVSLNPAAMKTNLPALRLNLWSENIVSERAAREPWANPSSELMLRWRAKLEEGDSKEGATLGEGIELVMKVVGQKTPRHLCVIVHSYKA